MLLILIWQVWNCLRMIVSRHERKLVVKYIHLMCIRMNVSVFECIYELFILCSFKCQKLFCFRSLSGKNTVAAIVLAPDQFFFFCCFISFLFLYACICEKLAIIAFLFCNPVACPPPGELICFPNVSFKASIAGILSTACCVTQRGDRTQGRSGKQNESFCR